MNLHRTTLLGVVLALALPAGTAAAAAPPKPIGDIPVPDGQVQHTVRTIAWESDRGRDWSSRVETWATTSTARVIHRDGTTGKLVSDCVETAKRLACYQAPDHTILDMPPGRGDRLLIADSWEREAALIRQQLEMGWFAFGADTTFGGRPAKVLEDTPQAPSDTDSRHIVTAEPDTLFPLKRVIAGVAKTDEGDQHFSQTEEVVLREVLRPSEVRIALGRYPGARARRLGDRTAGAAKARRAKKGRRGVERRRSSSRL